MKPPAYPASPPRRPRGRRGRARCTRRRRRGRGRGRRAGRRGGGGASCNDDLPTARATPRLAGSHEPAARGGCARRGRAVSMDGPTAGPRAAAPPDPDALDVAPPHGRRRPPRPPRLRALRGARRAARAAPPADRVAAPARGALRRGDRVHRLHLPAHPARGLAAPPRRRGRLRGGLRRALRHGRALPRGAHAPRAARARRRRARAQRRRLRRVAAPPRARAPAASGADGAIGGAGASCHPPAAARTRDPRQETTP